MRKLMSFRLSRAHAIKTTHAQLRESSGVSEVEGRLKEEERREEALI